MYVLGIETSCDETAAAIVRDGVSVNSNVVASSMKEHKKYGGIIPEIAFRAQLETITQVARRALKEAGIKLNEVGLVSVTSGPGLSGSLLVGICFAKAVSFAGEIPLLGVNHLHGHIYANFLNAPGIRLPFVSLIVSGGHTSLFYVEDFDRIKLLGATLDDAGGEAFDKVAKILGLGYPGGPLIERISQKGSPGKIKFGCSDTDKPLDFSFSGIKTAVLYYVRKQSTVHSRQSTEKTNRGPWTMDYGLTCDIAASFQEAVINALINKSFLACKIKKAGALVVGGGVAANNRLRQEFLREGREKGINVYFPPKEFCMDNAAMAAGLGYQLFKRGHRAGLDLSIDFN